MTRKAVLKWGLSALILVGLVFTAVRYLNGEALTQAFATFDFVYAPWIVALGLVYPVVKGLRLATLLKPVSDVPPRRCCSPIWLGRRWPCCLGDLPRAQACSAWRVCLCRPRHHPSYSPACSIKRCCCSG